MVDELKPPLLVRPIPKQRLVLGESFRLNLNDYIENSVSLEENQGEDPAEDLLFSVDTEESEGLPLDLDYTITGEVYGQPRPPALAKSPYKILVIVTNGAREPLRTTFELEILPNPPEKDAWAVDETLIEEFADERVLTEEEEQALFNDLKEQMDEGLRAFTEEKQSIWQAILTGASIPEMEDLMHRPIRHEDIYYLLGRMAYFVIWNAEDSSPAGALTPLHLKQASEHFDIYDRGSCIVATPKHLFDHNRTLLHAVRTAQAMANEVFKRAWKVEFGGFDKMVRAAWVEFELLSQKHDQPVEYAYFTPTAHDQDSLNQARTMRS